jgi:hypothetical protein
VQASGVELGPATGGAEVRVVLNHAPVIAGLTTDERVQLGHEAVEVDARVEASDPDGDELAYRWSAPGCTGATVTQGDERRESATVHVELVTTGCAIQVEVLDGRGGAAVGRVTLSPPPQT